MDESPDACEDYGPRTINIRGVCNKYIAYGPAMVGYLYCYYKTAYYHYFLLCWRLIGVRFVCSSS